MEEKNFNDNIENNIENQSEPLEVSDEASLIAEETISEVTQEISDTVADEATAQDTAIEEPVNEELVTDIPSAPAATYAFRWDYNEQRSYDDGKIGSKKSRGALTYAIILCVTLLVALAALAGSIILGDFIPDQSKHPMAFSDDLALDSLYEYCLPSYVAISVKTASGEGAGSGIIITESGYISTNYHVVEDAKKITVITYDGQKYDAEYIDGDEINDIAVIKISAFGLKAAVLGDSDSTAVGERVMAIGTPYSIDYRGSMTAGYISGVNRQYSIKNDNGTVNKTLKLLQTDTSVNPGNSGGPLFNMNGEVIGVVTMKIAGSNYEGMGFAIPINGVKNMIFDIIENGEITDSSYGSAVQGAALGISGREVENGQKYLITETSCIPVYTDNNGEYIKLQQTSFPYLTEKIYISDTEALKELGVVDPTHYTAPYTGVLVISATEGFDSAKKLEKFDIIYSVNGVVCEEMSVIQNIVYNSRIGDKLALEVYRNGRLINVTVELGRSTDME